MNRLLLILPAVPRLRLVRCAWALASVCAAVVVVSILVAALGASPSVVWTAFVTGSVAAPFSLGQSIMIGSVLTLTALAAAVPFSARMFNLGAEGQLYAGAIGATAVGLELSDHLGRPLLLACVLAVGGLCGALWAAVPGVMRVCTGANEVIVSLMLTFVAVLFAQYATLDLWPSGLAQTSEALPAKALLPTLSSATGITLGVIVALAAAAAARLLMGRTTLGFQIRATGLNPVASRLAGTPVGQVQVVSFVLGGTAAGLAGAIMVAGIHGGLIAGGAAGFGFLGIAVALVARLSPTWIVPAALLFAALRVGGNALQVDAGLSAAMGEVVVGVFMIALLAFGVIGLRLTRGAE